MVMPKPPPDPQPLLRVFDNAYLSLDERVWSLTPRACSKALLLKVVALCRSALPERFDIAALAANPAVDVEQYALFKALAAISSETADNIVTGWHVVHHRHPFPAALIDPRHRLRRWP
jgi:hypothetical protein